MTGHLQSRDHGILLAWLIPSPKTWQPIGCRYKSWNPKSREPGILMSKDRRRRVYPSSRREKNQFAFSLFLLYLVPQEIVCHHSDSHANLLWKHPHNTPKMFHQFSRYFFIHSNWHPMHTYWINIFSTSRQWSPQRHSMSVCSQHLDQGLAHSRCSNPCSLTRKSKEERRQEKKEWPMDTSISKQ